MGINNTVNDAHFTPERAPYVPVGYFRFWAQKVLPTVYDDSLSYYEILTKLVWQINKMIDDMDNFNQTIDSTLEAYDQLQNYVNTYFDSLDVQEEINNKLDEMASDGTLSAIIAPLILANLQPIIVDNVSKMTDKNRTYILSTDGHVYQWSTPLNSFHDTGLVFGNVGNYLTTKTYISDGDLNNVTPNSE